jgi:hypothetical protein
MKKFEKIEIKFKKEIFNEIMEKEINNVIYIFL